MTYSNALHPTLPAVAVFFSKELSGQIQIIVAQDFKQVFACTQILAQDFQRVFACRQIFAQDLKRVFSCRQTFAQNLKRVFACRQTFAQNLKRVIACGQIFFLLFFRGGIYARVTTYLLIKAHM